MMPPHTLRVALVQRGSEPDIDENAALAAGFLRRAKALGADLVLFPECFLTGYDFPDCCEALPPAEELEGDPDFCRWRDGALTEEEPHFKELTYLAASLRIGAVLTGFSKGERLPRNTAWVIGRDGRVLLRYHKVHTCAFSLERYLEPGDAFPVCDFDGVSLGCMICYDREYPESARELALGGAELIVHPNCCGTMEPRLRELSVRAMENSVAIAMANPPGPGMGRSCAVVPMVWSEAGEPIDNTLLVGEELREELYLADFDLDAIRAWREREDLGKFRRPAAYRRLTRQS